MSEHDPQQPNRQAGIELTPGHDPAVEPIDTGNRREQVHYEPAAEGLVKAKFTEHPQGPLPPQEQSQASDLGETPPQPHIGDVAVAPPGSSVWDARPPADDEERSGNPTGH
ncbi:hypothetical protein [Phenylobacterium deserti]|uniref:Uncharacterized protein n=1 Tax=Phenylobacterium deserti TaxID=1914756 RepID=A0A328ANB9_9CAUL|nr:hypothetical protein [Phenylobacterium deserti]RAK56420.1 hypothetical protein DJ018_00055 [Phenylobacterium deserti]